MSLKQVIVVNEALRMPRGKLAAQVAHASIAACLTSDQNSLEAWLAEGMPKIVLQVETDLALLALHEQAKQLNLPAQVIRDAGLTVLAPGTITCLGIGPADASQIDTITGKLRLLS